MYKMLIVTRDLCKKLPRKLGGLFFAENQVRQLQVLPEKKKKRNRNKTKTKLLEANFKLELIPFGYPIKDKSIFTAHRTQKVEYCKLPLTSSPIYKPAPSPVIGSSTCKKNTSDYKPGHPLAFIFMFILK